MAWPPPTEPVKATNRDRESSAITSRDAIVVEVEYLEPRLLGDPAAIGRSRGSAWRPRESAPECFSTTGLPATSAGTSALTTVSQG